MAGSSGAGDDEWLVCVLLSHQQGLTGGRRVGSCAPVWTCCSPQDIAGTCGGLCSRLWGGTNEQWNSSPKDQTALCVSADCKEPAANLGPAGSGPWVGWELLRADVTNHQRQWFRTTDIHSLPILAATNPKSRRQQGWLLLEALGAKRPAASGSGGRWQPFAFRSGRCLGLLPASHFTWPSAGSLVPPSPYQDAGCWVWGPHDIQEDPISRSLTQ